MDTADVAMLDELKYFDGCKLKVNKYIYIYIAKIVIAMITT